MADPVRVQTAYGPMVGCPVCGQIPLTGVLVCEHGVTPAPSPEIEVSISIRDRELYERLAGGG